MPERITPRSLIRETASRFERAGIPDPLVDAAATLAEDGSVTIPQSLRPYMGGKEILVP